MSVQPPAEQPGSGAAPSGETTGPGVVVDDLPATVLAACRGIADKQGRDTLVLDVGAVLSIAEHFVITSAPNDRQVKAIAEAAERSVRDATGEKPLRSEGLDTLHWVLLDYGDLVVHVFLDAERDFYELERLWSDVPRLAWDEVERSERDHTDPGDASAG